jgi:hypothetical protein
MKARPCTGLSLLNISLDTLRPDRFEEMTRRRGQERVMETIQHAVDLGFDPVKVRPSSFPPNPMQARRRTAVALQRHRRAETRRYGRASMLFYKAMSVRWTDQTTLLPDLHR